MSRPALSASRGIDILELLGNFPERQLTLSEIARATDINVSSCHQILTTLLDRGYITRHSDRKTYSLGASVVGLGQSALLAQPLIGRAVSAAEWLAHELDVPTLLTTAKGEELLAITAVPDASGRMPGVRVGERIPLIAPIGEQFMPWATEDRLQSWLARRDNPLSERQMARLQHDFQVVRARGFHLTLSSSPAHKIASLMQEISDSPDVSRYQEKVASLITALEDSDPQPDIIDMAESYEVLFITVPLLDQEWKAAYTLSLGEFTQKLTGAKIMEFAEKLLEQAMRIMAPVAPRGRTQRRARN